MRTKSLFILAFIGTQGLVAQDFVDLTDLDGNLVNGTTVVHIGSADSPVEEVDILATLNLEGNRMVNIRRYELDVQTGTQNYFCWGVCYGPQDAGALPSWSSLPQHAVSMAPQTEVNNFHAYHNPFGVVGSSTYRFVWFDVAAPLDSAWVDIEFQSTAVGVEELVAPAQLDIYPNPSRGSNVQVDVDLRGATGVSTLVVHNALGERVATYSVRTGQPTVRLSTENLPQGLYFASVDNAGRMVVTKRFVVSGR